MATARFDLTALAAETRAAISTLIDDAVAAERARIRELAVERGAGWQPTATCTCSRGTHEYTTGPQMPFADLLDGDGE